MPAQAYSECVLLGAGASKDGHIPTSMEMTGKVIATIEDQDGVEDALMALYYTLGGLMFGNGQRGIKPDAVDVEALMDALVLLDSRDQSELAPFISTWNEPKPEPGSFAGRALGAAARSAVLGSSPGFRPSFIEEKGLYDAVRSAARGPTVQYEMARRKVLGSLRDIVWITNEGDFEYLKPLVQFCANSHAAIATLNYDNSIELVGKGLSVQVNDGFTVDDAGGQPEFPDSQVPLIKLHGSINWTYSDARIEGGFEETEIVKVADPLSYQPKRWPYEYEPVLLFGGKNKLTASGPFLDLLAEFRSCLERSHQLTVIGYSFRDDHVNHTIAKWFNSNSEARIRVVDPFWKPMYGYDPHDSFRSRLTHLLRDSDRAELIEASASAAISSLWAV